MPVEIGLRALSRVLMIASGAVYGPRFESLERLYGAMSSGPWRDATLHGCHIMDEGARLMICREAVAISHELPAPPGETVVWDGRFQIRVPQTGPAGLTVSRLSSTAWKDAAALGTAPRLAPAVRAGLPMLCDGKGPAVVPWAAFARTDVQSRLKEPVFCRFTANSNVLIGAGDDVADLPP
jgi:hypothetical protein